MRFLRNPAPVPRPERLQRDFVEAVGEAGEKEYEIWKSREPSGVPINESVQGEINAVRDELGLDYTFPWEDGYKPYPETKKISAHIENL